MSKFGDVQAAVMELNGAMAAVQLKNAAPNPTEDDLAAIAKHAGAAAKAAEKAKSAGVEEPDAESPATVDAQVEPEPEPEPDAESKAPSSVSSHRR